jgi:hypothetical protein
MLWMKIHVGGQLWKVYLVSPKHKKLKGGDLNGSCHYEESKIYISKALDGEARDDTLLHELLHALMFVTGADKAYGGDAVKEEALVSALTPALHRVLVDLGFRVPRW